MNGHSPQDAALAYARAGWPVFPCLPGEKVPGTRNGFRDATTDPEQITRWWSARPDRNVAIATGAPGPDVVDVDNHGERGNGFAAWNELKRGGLVGHPRALVRTPSGGFHAYFAGSAQPSGKIPGRHLDWRAQGGYVVAPPSHVGGRPYVVVHHQPSPATVDFAAIRQLLDPQPQRPAPAARAAAARDTSLDRLVEWTASRQAGDRNFSLFYAARQAALSGLLDADAVERFVAAAARAGLRGGEREARRTIASAKRSTGHEAALPRPFARTPQRQLEAG